MCFVRRLQKESMRLRDGLTNYGTGKVIIATIVSSE